MKNIFLLLISVFCLSLANPPKVEEGLSVVQTQTKKKKKKKKGGGCPTCDITPSTSI